VLALATNGTLAITEEEVTGEGGETTAVTAAAAGEVL
jgi:hypothetical protein